MTITEIILTASEFRTLITTLEKGISASHLNVQPARERLIPTGRSVRTAGLASRRSAPVAARLYRPLALPRVRIVAWLFLKLKTR